MAETRSSKRWFHGSAGGIVNRNCGVPLRGASEAAGGFRPFLRGVPLRGASGTAGGFRPFPFSGVRLLTSRVCARCLWRLRHPRSTRDAWPRQRHSSTLIASTGHSSTESLMASYSSGPGSGLMTSAMPASFTLKTSGHVCSHNPHPMQRVSSTTGFTAVLLFVSVRVTGSIPTAAGVQTIGGGTGRLADRALLYVTRQSTTRRPPWRTL